MKVLVFLLTLVSWTLAQFPSPPHHSLFNRRGFRNVPLPLMSSASRDKPFISIPIMLMPDGQVVPKPAHISYEYMNQVPKNKPVRRPKANPIPESDVTYQVVLPPPLPVYKETLKKPKSSYRPSPPKQQPRVQQYRAPQVQYSIESQQNLPMEYKQNVNNFLNFASSLATTVLSPQNNGQKINVPTMLATPNMHEAKTQDSYIFQVPSEKVQPHTYIQIQQQPDSDSGYQIQVNGQKIQLGQSNLVSSQAPQQIQANLNAVPTSNQHIAYDQQRYQSVSVPENQIYQQPQIVKTTYPSLQQPSELTPPVQQNLQASVGPSYTILTQDSQGNYVQAPHQQLIHSQPVKLPAQLGPVQNIISHPGQPGKPSIYISYQTVDGLQPNLAQTHVVHQPSPSQVTVPSNQNSYSSATSYISQSGPVSVQYSNDQPLPGVQQAQQVSYPSVVPITSSGLQDKGAQIRNGQLIYASSSAKQINYYPSATLQQNDSQPKQSYVSFPTSDKTESVSDSSSASLASNFPTEKKVATQEDTADDDSDDEVEKSYKVVYIPLDILKNILSSNGLDSSNVEKLS